MTVHSADFDVIVVGSGATGGWAAKELSEQGFKVLMLERGKPLEHRTGYTTEHMPTWQLPDRDLPDRELYARDYYIQRQAKYSFDRATLRYWNNDRLNPYVQADGKPFYWLRADVVGGKSMMWGRHCYRWSDLDFTANKADGNGNDWPIRYADVAPWYSKVERFVGISGQAEGLPHLPDGEFQPPMAMTFVEKQFKTGVEKQFPGRCVTIGRVANLTRPIGERMACHYCGPCERGCSAGAYFSTQSSTLPAAMATGNLTLRPNSIVDSLEYEPGTKRVAAVRVIDAQNGTRTRITARAVFLCASTFGSLRILLNSRSEAFPTGLANSSGTLGRYVMDHYYGPGASGTFPNSGNHYYFGNRPNTLYIPRFRNLRGAREDVPFVRGYGYQTNAAPAQWGDKWSQIPGFGAPFKKALRQPGNWSMSLGGFAEMLPYVDNRVVLDSKVDSHGLQQLRFEVTYRENERLLGVDMADQAVAMLRAAGAVDIARIETPWTPGSSIHEFGGARMGHDSRDSVLNAHNQAHDVANLFVTDGACMASTSCVNPTLTFMALTARAAEYAGVQLKTRTI